MIRKIVSVITSGYFALAVIAVGGLIINLGPTKFHEDYIVRNVSPKVVKLLGTVGGGTGFVVEAPSGDKYTLTNAHVCGLSDTGFMKAVEPNTGRSLNLRIYEVSKKSDLCILEPMPGYGQLGVASTSGVGEGIGIVGHPLLQAVTLSRGYITSQEQIRIPVGRNMPESICDAQGGSTVPYYYITLCVKKYTAMRTNAQAYPGNSGSPVVNIYGNVVGVLFAADTTTHWGYLVPLNEVQDFLSIY